MSGAVWTENWRERVYERVKALGHADVSSFAATKPAAPFRELAAKLGDDVAGVQVEELLRTEAIESDRFEEFVRGCLARCLNRDLPNGWGLGEHAEFNTARAFASWSAAINEDPETFREQTGKVWSELHRLAPHGWRPDGADDQILLGVFEGLEFAH